jgi:hypothetical protein
MHIFKCFENQSDTYHDTWNHYLMEQDPLLLKGQVNGMDVVVVDKVEALKKKDGPSGASQYGSRYSMCRTCGPRDIISLVILRLGDNRSIIYKDHKPAKKEIIVTKAIKERDT